MQHLERAFDKQNQWYKYVIMFIVVLAANIAGSIPLVVLMLLQGRKNEGGDPANIADLSGYGISPNVGLILFIIPFIVSLILFTVVLRSMHRRKLTEVINGTSVIRWNRFFFSGSVWLIIMGIALLASYIANPGNFEFQADISSFIPLVILAILFIPVQAGFEEILFRGYLAQGIGSWTRNRWLCVIVPALFFGLIHSFNPEVAEHGFWQTIPQYISFGLLFGLISVLDDGIESAMGIHSANNIFLAIFITNKSSALQTPALFNQINVSPLHEMLLFLIAALILIPVLAYRYKWNFSIFNRKIQLADSLNY